MVSAQVPCLVRLFRTTPDNNKTNILQASIDQLAPAGGASEGALSAVSTPEKQFTINSGVEMQNDDFLEVSVVADSAKTLTASKCIWSIPLATRAGTKTLRRASFANPALGNTALPATTEVFVAGYRIIEGAARLVGKIYLDLQDNA